MTGRSLRELRNINRDYPSPDWHGTFTQTTVGRLLDEIDRLRVLVGDRPSYESDGTLAEAIRDLLD